MSSLPPKKEYVLYAPLSVVQRETYDQIVDGTLRQYLIGTAEKDAAEPDTATESGPRKLRSEGSRRVRKSFDLDGDDDDYFDMLERGEVDEHGVKHIEVVDGEKVEKDRQRKAAGVFSFVHRNVVLTWG